MEEEALHPIHDFTAKLRQPSVADRLGEYVQWRRELERARASGAKPPELPNLVPVSINLDLTTACNYRCTHCIDWDVLNNRHKHTEQEMLDSLAVMAERGLRSVILIGGGEPTLYPGFTDIVRYLKELKLQVAIVTNGSRGHILAAAAAYLDERDWIRMSLDSGSTELFAAMHNPRKGVDLDIICASVPLIKKANPQVPVGYSYIVVWRGASANAQMLHENIHEIAIAAERAKRYEFDYIAYKPILERADDGAEVMDPSKADANLAAALDRVTAELDKARVYADEKFKVYESINLQVLKDGSWREFTRQPHNCHMQAFRQVLSPMGLFNCPAHRGVSKALIADKTAYTAGERASRTGEALGALIDRFDAAHECREVTCLYNGVNWWIDGLINDKNADINAEIGPEIDDYFL